MKATADDFEPRRDGWFEHRGTWAEVTVGTVLADPQYRSNRWEVIDTAVGGTQIQYGYTTWFKVREQTSGEEHALQPRRSSIAVKILTQDPADTQTAPATPASDSEVMRLLIEKLGAETMATHDAATGEIHCPDYVWNTHDERVGVRRGLIDHMRFAHEMQTPIDTSLESAIELHAQQHRATHPTGFPHRHVPENFD